VVPSKSRRIGRTRIEKKRVEKIRRRGKDDGLAFLHGDGVLGKQTTLENWIYSIAHRNLLGYKEKLVAISGDDWMDTSWEIGGSKKFTKR